ncbi:mannose/glucose-specific lectin-like [Humulus lupulus]|uniref:mannose/glucose-specific lectin-like n=1 Tax=Humulus lupulus TaxID=3486 RepID=UPI002B4089F0|nr:mannose/glucose-specific lectin-like [Humulus lupulus]
MAKIIPLRQWGSDTGGDPWSYIPTFPIGEITINVGGNIKSISFKDVDGVISGTFGGRSPDPTEIGREIKVTYSFIINNVRTNYLIDYSSFFFSSQISIYVLKIPINWPLEYLTAISGTYGNYNGAPDVITSISFTTNFQVYGPFGTAVGTPFATSETDYLDAIGIYVLPNLVVGKFITFVDRNIIK